MTNKEIAEKLRYVAEYNLSNTHLTDLADELDPPLPEPGTVVWWQDIDGLSEPKLGMVNEYGCIEVFGSVRELEENEVKWKPARFLGPDEVAVRVPPIEEWPPRIHAMVRQWQVAPTDTDVIITRAEAERIEAGDDS